VTFAVALGAIGTPGDDPDALADLARLALEEGEEEAALRVIAPAAEGSGDARLWQWTGLLNRALDDHALALDAFASAARFDPDNASIAHGHARVALEAGLDARALFDRALVLGVSGDVILGRGAARFAMGEGKAVAADLATLLDHNPLWGEGHVQWAQLSAMNGNAADATATIDRALARHSNEPALWHTAIHILTSAGRHAEAWEYADRAIAATADPSGFALARAAALSDSGEAGEAEQAFAALGEPASPAHAVHLSRHLIRLERWAPLAGLVDRWTVGESAHAFWPYASIAWRMTGDARWSWLEGDERLVRTYDLLLGERALDDLAAKLRLLHAGSGRFLDQSVRGGTQTDGPLFSRLDPEIRTLRETVETAVADYRAGLPPIDASHPMLRHRRDRRLRFAGSWSVRLSGAGFHSNHVHSQGWISSAFYVSVPPDLPPDQGWLTLGEPQAELGLDLPALHRVEPRPGRLVLFPSMMWHGTLPFAQGERLTVAFDVARPR